MKAGSRRLPRSDAHGQHNLSGALVSCKPEFGSSVLIDKRCTRRLGFTPRRCTVGLSPSGSVDRPACFHVTRPATAGAFGLADRARCVHLTTLRQRGRARGLLPPTCCLLLSPRQREPPGSTYHARCVQLTTPASAGAPGLAAIPTFALSSHFGSRTPPSSQIALVAFT
jgi:hypothetical protein